MSTGLLLFLVFLALSIIDSVARVRRGQKQQAVLPPEDEGDEEWRQGDEEWRQEPSSTQVEGKEAGRREPAEALGELLGLEKLMGPGYLEKLMGPGIAGAMEEEEDDIPERTAPVDQQVATAAARSTASAGGDGRRVAREGRTPDQERRRAEARRRRSGVDQPSEAGGRRRAQQRQPTADRRLRDREDAGSRPARAARETAPLRDSAVDRDRDRPVPMPGGPPGLVRRDPRRTRLYRELFGTGGRKSLQRAFVLKEILDAPASERREGR